MQTWELLLLASLGLGGGPGLDPLGLRVPPSGASARRVQGCSAEGALPDSQGLFALLRPARLGKSFSKGGCSQRDHFSPVEDPQSVLKWMYIEDAIQGILHCR